jgi:hypothetical protein
MSVRNEKESKNTAVAWFTYFINKDRVYENIKLQEDMLLMHCKSKDTDFYKKYMKQLDLEKEILMEILNSDGESSGLDTDSDEEQLN